MNHASDIPSESDRWRLNCTATFVFLRLSGYVLFTCIKYVTCIIYLMIHIHPSLITRCACVFDCNVLEMPGYPAHPDSKGASVVAVSLY